jgi:hypothetical protein
MKLMLNNLKSVDCHGRRLAIGSLGVLVEVDPRQHDFYPWTSILSIASIPEESDQFKHVSNVNKGG